jgi:hypothetical protein
MLATKNSVVMNWTWPSLALLIFLRVPAHAEPISLQALVEPSTVIRKDGNMVNFALHGFIEFQSLAEMFPYIDAQLRRWNSSPEFTEKARNDLRRDLLRRGIESRVMSMLDERPLETLVTHTRAELSEAIHKIKEPIPEGYLETFLEVQEKWKHSLNCWSASPSIPGRVLSNWYPIEEGIQLYGATYDSTEHFWQAVKYHPAVTVAEIKVLLVDMEQAEWASWLKRLDDNPRIYLSDAYAVEFLRHNLTRDRLRWFRDELDKHSLVSEERARASQQRLHQTFRFTAYEEKVLWGDLADVFHLVYTYSLPTDPIRQTLAARHFDGIYLENRKFGFISEEFRSLMLEIWKVKFLKIARFREIIGSIPQEIRLSHFLNDGDSPDIPIPIYVGYLNQIRDMAISEKRTLTTSKQVR